MSDLNDEITEEEKRRKEPPDPESANHILLQIQQTVGQMAGQMKELQSSVSPSVTFSFEHPPGIVHTKREKRKVGRCQDTISIRNS